VFTIVSENNKDKDEKKERSKTENHKRRRDVKASSFGLMII
jgi:hypothetical protein